MLNLKTCHYNQYSTQRTAMIFSAYVVQTNSNREIDQKLRPEKWYNVVSLNAPEKTLGKKTNWVEPHSLEHI